MELGTGKKIIVPGADAPHINWGAQSHIAAEGSESELYARACVIRDGETLAVTLDIDACMFSPEQSDRIRKLVAEATGAPVPNVRLSYSHSHATPAIVGSIPEQWRAGAARYFELIVERAVEAAAEAAGNLERVTALSGFGRCALASNRRQTLGERLIVGYNPEGETSDQLAVVRFETEDGNAKAHFVCYACHPTTLGYPNKLVSPDYPGTMRAFVETQLGGVCLFLQGSTGDLGPGPHGFLDRVDEMRKLGLRLGMAAGELSLRLSAEAEAPTFREVVESGASLGIWDTVRPGGAERSEGAVNEAKSPVMERVAESVSRLETPDAATESKFAKKPSGSGAFEALSFVCPLPLRELPDYRELERDFDRLSQRADELRSALEAADGAGPESRGSGAGDNGGNNATAGLEELRQELKTTVFRARRLFLAIRMCKGYEGQTHVNVEVQIFRVGEAVLIGCPVEPFNSLQRELQARFPGRQIWLSGYTNGWIGYLADNQGYSEGGYEVETSPFRADSAERFLDAVSERLAAWL